MALNQNSDKSHEELGWVKLPHIGGAVFRERRRRSRGSATAPEGGAQPLYKGRKVRRSRERTRWKPG